MRHVAEAVSQSGADDHGEIVRVQVDRSGGAPACRRIGSKQGRQPLPRKFQRPNAAAFATAVDKVPREELQQVVLAHAAADEHLSETSIVDGACEVSVTGNRYRFEDGMHWADGGLPGVIGAGGRIPVVGHGHSKKTLRTTTGKLLCFLVCARHAPGLEHELISDFTPAKLGLRIVKEAVGKEVELCVEDKNTGERSVR